jgi:methionyl-tRNA formyltransferase
MRVVFFGTPEFAVPALHALLDSGHEVLAVVTQVDKRSGRGMRMNPPPVKTEAQKEGLRILQPLSVRDMDFINQLRELSPSVIVVVAYGRILPPEIIHLPDSGCINIHASLLPKYRGAAPVNWAIINGEDRTGVTTMLMDEGMDTGPILLQEEVEIKREDTAGSLLERLSKIGADLLVRTLEMLQDGRLKPVPQRGTVSYAPMLKKGDGLIDWLRPADELFNFIRGMNPWPCAFSFLQGERLKILKSAPVDETGEAGVIYRVSREELLVGTGKGVLSILEIQPSGRPVMPIRAFLQGRRLREGMRFDQKSV